MSVPRPAVAVLALALVVTACVSDAPERAEVAPSATPFIELPLDQAVERFLDDPFEVAAALLADRFGATDDPGYVPHLVDLLRVGTSDDLAVRAGEALERVTGEPRPDDHREAYLLYGTWLETHDLDPAEGYLDWKARLLADIDPAFERLVRQVEDPLLAARLRWGGVVVGGIPELNDPDVLSPTQARFMTDDEIVFGVEVDGEARAYPLRILGHHELANDHLGGIAARRADPVPCRPRPGVLVRLVRPRPGHPHLAPGPVEQQLTPPSWAELPLDVGQSGMIGRVTCDGRSASWNTV